MPKYEVVFTRTITESTTIIGYADDLEQAKDAALELLWSLESADWEVDDVPAGEAYITSVEEVE